MAAGGAVPMATGVALMVLASLWAVNPASGAQPTSRPRSGPAPLPDGFIARELRLPDGSVRKYTVFVPADYDRDASHKWPVIVFLHGSGECGVDGRRQTRVGLPKYIAGRPKRFPFITVMPQARTLWFRNEDAAAVWLALEEVHRDYRTDRDRVYLTGLSMGGFGVWELAMLRPDVFAAIVPVCGVGHEDYVSNIVHVPVWAFHGAKDRNVPVAGSRKPIEALRRLGAKPKYTEFPTLGHQCWDRAYATRGLWPWLLKQHRGGAPRTIDYRLPRGTSRLWWLAVEAEPEIDHPAHIHATLEDKGRVSISSDGIRSWALISDSDPLKPGEAVEVTWNDKPVYRGPFKGTLKAPSQKATTTGG